MQFFLAVLLFVSLSARAGGEVIYSNEFNSANLGLNPISGTWNTSNGSIHGYGFETWPDGRPQYNCPEQDADDLTPVLCHCVRNCDARPVTIQPIAVKRMSLPQDYNIRTSFHAPLGMTVVPDRVLGNGAITTGVLFDFVNPQNYKGILYYSAYDRTDGKTYLYCQPFKVESAQWSYHSQTRCARLDDTAGLVNAVISVRGREVVLRVNGVRNRVLSFGSMGRGAVGFYPVSGYSGFDFLQVDAN